MANHSSVNALAEMPPPDDLGPPWIDEILPEYDVETAHATTVDAPQEAVYEAVRSADLSSSAVVRLLFWLRGIPRVTSPDDLAQIGFRSLVEAPPTGFVMGVIGRFWVPTERPITFEPGEFREFDTPGFAKAISSFDLTAESPETTLLRTVTRVRCTDPESRKRFMRYWKLVGPFSGLIRTKLLGIVQESAEWRGG